MSKNAIITNATLTYLTTVQKLWYYIASMAYDVQTKTHKKFSQQSANTTSNVSVLSAESTKT